ASTDTGFDIGSVTVTGIGLAANISRSTEACMATGFGTLPLKLAHKQKQKLTLKLILKLALGYWLYKRLISDT
ncbi:MAG: hypothetical protein ACK55Z_05720, partial [bacterium]